MLAIDTSSLIAFLTGAPGPDADTVDYALKSEFAVLPPVVLSELLSDPKLHTAIADTFRQMPLLDILPGYWERAGKLRSRLLARRLRSRLADALIAQSCIDHDVPLVSRDRDFRHYVRSGGLKLFSVR